MAQTLFTNPLYLEAAQKVAARIDRASAREVDIFGQPFWKKHFTLGRVHTVDSFETILKQSYFAIAASTIQGKSAEPLRAMEGFTGIKQEMFTFAHAYRMEADEIRNLIIRLSVARESEKDSIVADIVKAIMNVKKGAIEGVDTRLDIMIIEALFNELQYTFTKDNDPQSPWVGQTIDFGHQTANGWTVGSGNEWVAAHKGTVDPVKEISEIVQASATGIEKILLNRTMLNFILSTDAMKGYINNQLTSPNLPLTEGRLNSWMADQGLPTFEVVERKVNVQDGDKIIPYDLMSKTNGKLVFLPTSAIGTIETRMTDHDMGLYEKDGSVKYSKYGRVELQEYTMGVKQNSDYTEITKAVLHAAPAFETAKDILTLDTTK